MDRRPLGQCRQRLGAHAARWHVHDPLERHPVCRIARQPQIRDQVTNLSPVVEARRADQPIGNPAVHQRFLDRARLRVGPIQHRGLARPHRALLHPVRHGLRDVVGLVALAVCLVHPRTHAVGPVGLQLPLDPPLGSRDHRIGHVQNLLRGAVVLVQLHLDRVGVVFDKAAQVAHVGGAPRVDRLVGVAHDGQVAAALRPRPRQRVLHHAGVLKLVDQRVLEPRLVVLRDLADLEQVERPIQQVVEVERLRVVHALAIALPDPRHDLLVVVGRVAHDIFERHALALVARDSRKHLPRRELLGIEVQLLDRGAHQGHLVVVVEDREVLRHADLVAVRAQHPHADAVKRAQPEPVRVVLAEQLLEPRTHLARRLVGERDGQNPPGRHALLAHQPADPLRHHPCLATARPRHNQQGATRVQHGLPLRGVQVRQIERSSCGHTARLPARDIVIRRGTEGRDGGNV